MEKNKIRKLDYEDQYSIGTTSIFSYSYNLRTSKRYVPKRNRSSIFDRTLKAEWNNFVYDLEVFLKGLQLSAINFNLGFFSYSDTSIDIISVDFSVFNIVYSCGEIGLEDLDIGLSLLGANAGLSVGVGEFDAHARAVVGELVLSNEYGSVGVNFGIGGELSFENGEFNFGISFGWGFSVSINFNKLFS